DVFAWSYLHDDVLQMAVIATADCCRSSPASPAWDTEHRATIARTIAPIGGAGLPPTNPSLSGKPATLFQPTPANPNKIKGHGNPVPGQCDLLSQRKKSVITDTYVTF
uniref:hypothetical protein n=1 Tax=Aeromonas veronii TaxID=654 RepID=UPI003D1D226B